MTSRRNFLAMMLVLFSLAAFGPAIAAPAGAPAATPRTPVVTTPTPIPTPTPKTVTLAELKLTPGVAENIKSVYLPSVVDSGGGSIVDAPQEAFTYTVKQGDTLWSLALDMGRDLDTMSCATTPAGSDAETLVPGQVITIPALADLCYTVRPGDTLTWIAAQHRLSVAQIVAVPWNALSGPPYRIQPRQRILLPGVKEKAQFRPEPRAVSVPQDAWAGTAFQDWPYGDGKFIWPVEGPISQYAHRGHMALDIAVPDGTKIKAADRGTVVMAGWNPTGYGFRVVIDHGIDYVTLYAHLSDIYVQKGQVVAKGQVIGVSGANGNITGPHLHFELRDYGRLVDPLPLLNK
jgi:murein DD-endopeptidase MepM/ murein hydrolase activator NlpD